MDKSILKYLSTTYKQYIKPPYDILFESYGIDMLCDLSDYLGGEVYIPNIRTMLNECIVQDILQNKEKRNVRELSRRYGISARQIHNIRNAAKTRLSHDIKNDKTIHEDLPETAPPITSA